MVILHWSFIVKIIAEHHLHLKLLPMAVCSNVIYASAWFAALPGPTHRLLLMTSHSSCTENLSSLTRPYPL